MMMMVMMAMVACDYDDGLPRKEHSWERQGPPGDVYSAFVVVVEEGRHQ